MSWRRPKLFELLPPSWRGFQRMSPRTSSIIPASTLLNRTSDMSTAMYAPPIAPMIAGIERRRLNLKLETPFRLKPAVANAHWAMIAIRLVPFATAVGKPRKMSIGRVSSEPPPARVLMNPASMPAKKMTGMCQISIRDSIHRSPDKWRRGQEGAKKDNNIG